MYSYGFGNWIVPTPTTGDSSNQVADTAFVTQAIASSNATLSSTLDTVFGSTRGSLLERAASGWTTVGPGSANTVWTSNGPGADPTYQAIPGVAGAFVTSLIYSSSQTVTIPASATRGWIRMWGASGGSGGAIGNSAGAFSASGGAGAGGYLEKTLTGLTAGSTLVYTQGTAGAAGTLSGPGNGGNGGASTLASGTQTITTLTANGSNGTLGAGSTINSAGTSGGTATNGDLNFTGASGQNGVSGGDNVSINYAFVGGKGGDSSFSPGANGVASTSASAGNAGRSGGLGIIWFT